MFGRHTADRLFCFDVFVAVQVSATASQEQQEHSSSVSCVLVCAVLALDRHSSILCDSPNGQEGALNRAAMERRIRTLEDEVSGGTRIAAAHRIIHSGLLNYFRVGLRGRAVLGAVFVHSSLGNTFQQFGSASSRGPLHEPRPFPRPAETHRQSTCFSGDIWRNEVLTLNMVS